MNPPLAQLDELPPPPGTSPDEVPAPGPVATLDELPDPAGQFVAQAPVSFWKRPITAIAQGIGQLFVDKPEGLQVSPQGVELMALREHLPRDVAAEVLRAAGASPDAGSQIYAPGQVDRLPRIPDDRAAAAALWRAAAQQQRTGETAAREADRLAPFPAPLRPLIGAGRGAGDALVSSALYAGALAGGGEDTRTVLADQGEQAAARQEGRDRNQGGLGRVTERAGSTVLSMLATPGGQGAKILQAALTQGGQSYADAIQAGLSDAEARQYAAKQAIAEAVPAAIMSAAGHGGVERQLSELGAAKGSTLGARLRDAAAGAGRTILEEQPEELATTLAQQQLQTQIDPNAMNNDQLATALGQTVAQTALAGGFSHVPETIGALFGNGQHLPQPMPTVVANQPRPGANLPPGVAAELAPEDLARIAASNKAQAGRSTAPVDPAEARANTEADLEQGGFQQLPPELLRDIARLLGGEQPPTAPAADPTTQPSHDTQAPPLSGPGSDRTTNDRAVDEAPAGAIPEAAPSPAPAPAPPDPAARAAAEQSDLGTGTTLSPEQPVDVKVGRNVHQGTVAAVNEDGTVSVRLQDGRIVPKVPAFRVIPREAPKPEQQQIDTAPAPAAAPAIEQPAAPTPVDAAAAEAHPAPSEAQKEAGNYQKGHVRIHGMDVTIENARGSERSGTDANGKLWSVTMPAHYGYVRGTLGADGDHVDVYVGPHPEKSTVYVVDQIDAATGKFDEHKAMLGFDSKAAALAAYDAAFSDGKGPQRRGAVTPMPVAAFKKWSASHQAKKPLRYKPSAAPAPQSAPEVQREQGQPTPKPQFQARLFQGRGAKPEDVYGPEAVAEGRAAPILGPGDYFAHSAEDASQYGTVSEHDVALQKPFIIDTDAKWRAVLQAANATHLDSRGREFYTDPKGVPAASARLQSFLRKLGYDGVIVKTDGDRTKALLESFGHDQVMRFNTEPQHGNQPSPTAAEPAPAPSGVPPVAGRVEERPSVAPAVHPDARAGEESTAAAAPRHRAKTPAPSAPEPVAPADKSADEIADFGQKIGGSRKDQWRARGLAIGDLAGMSDTEQQTNATKDNVWPTPDYAALVAAGMPKPVAWLVKQVRDKLASAPVMRAADAAEATKRSTAISRYVEVMGQLRDRLAAARTPGDITAAGKAIFPSFWARSSIDQVSAPTRERDQANYRLIAKDNGVARAMSPGGWELSKAEQQIERTGWPDGEPWQRKFRIRIDHAGSQTGRQVDGKWVTTTSTVDTFDVVENAKGRSHRVIASGFATREEAEAAARAAYDSTKSKGAGEQLTRPYNRDAKRIGEDHRGGKNVTPDQLLKTFGFRGGEFGNWTNQADRQQSLNQAFDGMMDLALLLNLPPKALSLNGELAIAFGARGGGKNAAHYEPGRVVINLTKTKGAGALAHEWFHAVDDYFGRAGSGGRAGRYVSENKPGEGVRSEVRQAWESVMQTISTNPSTGKKSTFLANSEAEDGHKHKDYWSTRREMFARAGESWVQDRLHERGVTSPYLVDGTTVANPDSPSDWEKVFPAGDERIAINNAFDRWAGTMRTEKGADDKVRLFAPERTPGEEQPSAAPADDALEGPDRQPGAKPPTANPKPEAGEGIEALVRWALQERQKAITDMRRRAERSGDPDMAAEYKTIASQYEAVDPDELAAHMRAYPAHYLKAISTLGGSMDPVQVYRQRAELPPLEPRVAIAPAPAPEGVAPDLRTTLKTLATDLRRAAPSAPTLAVDRGALPQGSAGEFDTRSGGITVRYHNDLDLVAHEVGHWAAETYGLKPAATDAAARSELARFGVHGTPATGETLIREGMAEYLRAWMVNPGETETRAPAFSAIARQKIPPRVLDALRAYGDSVRAFAGAPAVQQVAAGVMATKAAAKEEKGRVRISRLIIDGVKGLFGAGRTKPSARAAVVPKGFNASVADKLRFAVTDQQAPQLANYLTSLALVGVDPARLKPSQHWDYLRKFSRGEAGRLRDMVLEHGLATADLQVAKDDKTGEAMTLGWLLDPITALGERWMGVLDKAHAYGVAERSVELEDRFTTKTENEITAFALAKLQEAGGDRYAQEKAEREVKAFARQKREELNRKLARLTAAGGGINSASDTARRALSELDQDADQPAIREYLRRYRTWADFNLAYAVRTELLTPQAAQSIREANQAYIDWHRVFGDDDAPINIGEAVEGSARTIHNPLASLLHATWSVVSRGDRNRLMQSFVAPLLMAPKGDTALSRSLSTLGRRISKEEADEAYQKQSGYHDDATGERRRVYRVQRLMQATNEDGSPVIDKRTGQPAEDIATEHWVFDSGSEASLEAGRSMLSDHPWMMLMQGLNALQRNMITLAPAFRFKVPVRDNAERLMNSETGSGLRDMGTRELGGRPLDELFTLSGASLAGWNQHTRDSALAEVLAHVADMRRSRWRVLSPSGWLRGWHRFGEASENVARKAEFAAGYRQGEKKGYDDLDASLYAMTHSRGLLDTAEHGYLIGRLNGIALFLNASIKGLQRTTKMGRAAVAAYRRGDVAAGNRLAATLTLRTAMLGATYAAARLAFLASLEDDDEKKKALREPAWKRDFALRFNLPLIGKIAIPKPYEWGWLASGFERAADLAFAQSHGWHDDARRAYEGYGRSFIGAIMPVREDVIAGGFTPAVEILTNHSFFTDSHIIPVHEEQLEVGLRKGTANASPLGKLLAKVLPADPRNIDHLIRGYFGGYGSAATARTLGELARRITGYSGETSIYASRDVQWVMDYTDSHGVSSRPEVRTLHQQLKAASNEQDEARRAKMETSAIKQAERIRAMIEKYPKAWRKEP